jgi:signal transduction histidine kinase
MGNLELMIGAEDRPQTRADLEEIRLAGERAAKIVRNLLSFARKSALARSVEDLNELVRATLAWRVNDLRAHEIAVDEEYARELPLILVNREEIQQVVLNLLLNAEHATRATRRPGTVRIRTTCAGGTVSLEIADEGSGVPSDVAARIFEPFFTTKFVDEGTGLGLSVSLGIAEAHGGALTLVPTERGARFQLTLPVAPMPSVDAVRKTVEV